MNFWEIKRYKDFRKIVSAKLYSENRENGFFEITLKDWRLLDAILYTMIEMSHAIFRGVENEAYVLEPSIFRGSGFKNMKNTDIKNVYINRCYDHFVEAIRGRRGPLSKPVDMYNRYELWSLGRHFGVRNTLLDWSHSPYVCLFFAFANWYKSGTRSLYCLKRNIIKEAREENLGSFHQDDISLTANPDYNSLLFYKPMSDDNFRMINQQGLFTVSRSHNTIEEWVSQNYGAIRSFLERKRQREQDNITKSRLKIEIDSSWILLRINIETNSSNQRAQILKKLNRMNINYATLFPDIEGASLYANMQGDIKHY